MNQRIGICFHGTRILPISSDNEDFMKIAICSVKGEGWHIDLSSHLGQMKSIKLERNKNIRVNIAVPTVRSICCQFQNSHTYKYFSLKKWLSLVLMWRQINMPTFAPYTAHGDSSKNSSCGNRNRQYSCTMETKSYSLVHNLLSRLSMVDIYSIPIVLDHKTKWGNWANHCHTLHWVFIKESLHGQ